MPENGFLLKTPLSLQPIKLKLAEDVSFDNASSLTDINSEVLDWNRICIESPKILKAFHLFSFSIQQVTFIAFRFTRL